MQRVYDCPAAVLCREEGIMAITLNHTIVPAKDKQASAQFFAHIFGLQVKEGEGRFAQVQVNDTLTMDFDQLRPVVESIHYAFHVSDAEFDGIYDRVKAAGIAYGSGPFDHKNMQINSARRSPPGSARESILAKALRPLPARWCAARCPPLPPRSADSSLASDRQ